MPTWPASIPSNYLLAGMSLSPISNAIPIDVESGEPMTRVRFTGEMDEWNGTIPPLTQEQATDLLNFWRYDLKNGTLRFTFDHPLTCESVECLMPTAPNFVPLDGGDWQVSLKLQSMP